MNSLHDTTIEVSDNAEDQGAISVVDDMLDSSFYPKST